MENMPNSDLLINNITFPNDVFYSLLLRFTMLFTLYIPLMILFNISEDLNKTISEVWNKCFKKN